MRQTCISHFLLTLSLLNPSLKRTGFFYPLGPSGDNNDEYRDNGAHDNADPKEAEEEEEEDDELQLPSFRKRNADGSSPPPEPKKKK